MFGKKQLTKMIRAIRRLIYRSLHGYNKFIVISILGVMIFYLIQTITYKRDSVVWNGNISALVNTPGFKCGLKCADDELSYFVKSGTRDVTGPVICFNNQILMSSEMKNVNRGINAAFIDGLTLKPIEAKVFDTYTDDTSLLKYLQRNVKLGDILIMSSFDEMSFALGDNGKRWLKLYGSSLIDKLHYRDSFVMIGQKGLKPGHAIEQHDSGGLSSDFGLAIVKHGCFSIPMGKLSTLEEQLPEVLYYPHINYKTMRHCGVERYCEDNTYMISINTGHANGKYPIICINGKIIVDQDLNKSGRGFNIVIIDPYAMHNPTMVGHFDTYLDDSTNLELIMETLSGEEIIVAIVYDDGSKQLSPHAKELFNVLGSGLIQNLKFRDAWYFIGQRGIKGFTTFEKISYAGFDTSWPESLEASFCVPKKIVGIKTLPDPHVYRNDKKRDFCTKHDGYPDLCDPSKVDEKLNPVGVIDKDFSKHKVFSTPIIMVAGMNHNSLVRTLETTIMQPGINPDNVVVMFDEKFGEFAEVADLYGFKNHSLHGSTSYEGVMIQAIKESLVIFPDEQYIIFVEEELLLAVDFLQFIGQCMDVVDSDETLAGASAYNYNGYEGVSSDPAVLYRVDSGLPGLGFFIKRHILEDIASSFSCCNMRVWYGWNIPRFSMLVPDVSRVYRMLYQGAMDDSEFIENLFSRKRVTSMRLESKLTLAQLTKGAYDIFLEAYLQNGTSLPEKDIHACSTTSHQMFSMDIIRSDTNYVAYFKQVTSQDYSSAIKLCKCLGLFSSGNHTPYNIYHNLLRFNYQGSQIFLVGSGSPYFKYRLPGAPIIT